MPRAALAAAGALAAAALWWRRHPSACPYGQRFWLAPPRPLITRRRLLDVLAPAPGERILDLGAGTGYYALDVARAVAPGGELEAFDLQPEMLADLAGRAEAAGVGNVRTTAGDATALPHPDASFDAVYLVTVLGEIPDQDGALREVRRVLRPGGRLVVGELAGDPHMVTLGALRRRAAAAGLRFERRAGTPLGFFARFAAPAAA
jgi:ubiquinone/menaquinone biosynthesis C-methylase UbiE